MADDSGVNKEYKDRLFNFISGREENKVWTLSLYNAVNGSSYTNPEREAIGKQWMYFAILRTKDINMQHYRI